MPNETLKRELLIAVVVLALGFFALPFLIYWVGRELIGDYAAGGGMALAESIWTDLLHLQPAAWALLLCPYGIVQLARLAWRLWRTAPL